MSGESSCDVPYRLMHRGAPSLSYSDREVWLPAIVITSAPDGRPTAETGALSAFAFVDIVLHIDPP